MKKNKLIRLGVICTSAAMLASGCGQAGNAASGNPAETVTMESQAGDAAEESKDGTGDSENQSAETGNETEAAAIKGTAADWEAEIKDGTATVIELSDEQITVDGEAVDSDSGKAVYTAHDIVYYEAGKDFTYGEGAEADEHTEEEAGAHTVVHITQPGTYVISGTLSAGQIAVDLGEGADEDPEAVVTLVLDNADITCTVAPAVIFYEVYECGSTDGEDAGMDVDTSAAGANVILADGSVNQINGSYVARIYKSYELNEAGTGVVDSKKLHKYDGAFYSKMSMNIDGGEIGDGILNITAENEGLDSELHLTINGGNINITSGNDGINTNEDGISVTTINGGTLTIDVEGSTGEGDGIDSNGWLVINGGTVVASACGSSMDSGIDADMGIVINGGTVAAAGNMLDRISEDGQTVLEMTFSGKQKGDNAYTIKDENGETVYEFTPANDFSCLVFSSPELADGSYTIWLGETELSWSEGDSRGGGHGGPRGDRGSGDGVPRDGAGRENRPDRPDREGAGSSGRPDGEEAGSQDRPNGEEGSQDRPNREGAEG